MALYSFFFMCQTRIEILSLSFLQIMSLNVLILATKTFGSRSHVLDGLVHEPRIRAGVNLFVVLTPMGNNPIFMQTLNCGSSTVSRVHKSTISFQGVPEKIVNQINYSYEVPHKLD